MAANWTCGLARRALTDSCAAAASPKSSAAVTLAARISA
jgi:hypothetical protein